MRTRRRRRGDSEQAETSYGAERYTLTHTHTCTLRLGHTLGEIERASERASESPSCTALSSSSSWRSRGGCRDAAGIISKVGRVHAPRARGARHLRRGRRHLTSKTPCRGDECVVRGTPSGSEAPRPAFMCTTERRQICRWVEVERLRPPAHNPPSHPPEDLPNSPVLPMLFIFFRMLLFLVFFSFVFFA